jgi:hypothetical protein
MVAGFTTLGWLPPVPGLGPARLRRQATVFEHAEAWEDGVALVAATQASAGTVGLRPCGDVLTQQGHAACRRRNFARQQIDQRGLARTIGADHRMNFTLVQIKRHVVDRHQAAPTTG